MQYTTPPDPPRRSTTWVWAAAGFGGVIAVVALLFALGVFGGDDETGNTTPDAAMVTTTVATTVASTTTLAPTTTTSTTLAPTTTSTSSTTTTTSTTSTTTTTTTTTIPPRLDISLDARQELSLPQGFPAPDPRTLSISSGGAISTDYLNSHPQHASGDCTGYAIKEPDLEFQYTAGTPQALLRFFWEGTGDAVLIINAPDGKWYCNDDTAGFNPQITFTDPAIGSYDVYVAKRTTNSAGDGTLSITEFAGVVVTG